MTVIYVYSLCNVHVNCLTRLQCFLQGDIGLTGPPGMPGAPVSEISDLFIYLFFDS